MAIVKEDMSTYYICDVCDCELETDNYTEGKCFVCGDDLLPMTKKDEITLCKFREDMSLLDNKGRVAYIERILVQT